MTNNIRNFVIIAHIDHGKSTLADRFLEITGTISAREMHAQYLDSMDLERERGITIKMAPVQMHWDFEEGAYELNLIDTPGHVDFSYEVSRALAAVEGAILLVDATKGVQAQTLAHLREALRQKLVVIPAINKIDLPAARVHEAEEEIRKLLPDKKIFHISAKDGTGVRELLAEVIRRVPPPKHSPSRAPRALVFDSQYSPHKGVLAYVRVVDGSFRSQQWVRFAAHGKSVKSIEVGTFAPHLAAQKEIGEGSIGYVATGIKEPEIVRVGDTIFGLADSTEPSGTALSGYQEPRPVVFASIFPAEGVDIALLADAFSKLKLSHWALTFEPESSDILGRGFRCGFLGSLHLEIVLERLRREFGLDFVATTPSVRYEVTLAQGQMLTVYTPSEFPEGEKIQAVKEPWVRLHIFTPSVYMGLVMELLHRRRGVRLDSRYLTPEHLELIYEIPLAEIIVDFYDTLKSVSSGFASLSYEHIGARPGALVRLEVLVAGEPVEAFSRIVPRERSFAEGKEIVRRLREYLPRQLFVVPIQALIEGRIIARETLPALRKDVTGYLYGGDVTRKRKLLEKQKRGKKKLAKQGRVTIPHEVFIRMLRSASREE